MENRSRGQGRRTSHSLEEAAWDVYQAWGNFKGRIPDVLALFHETEKIFIPHPLRTQTLSIMQFAKAPHVDWIAGSGV